MASHKSDINVGIKFNADTSQAQQQIQALQASLNKVSMAGSGKGISAEMQKAAVAAQQLQMHLQKAYNSKTGNLDLSLLNRSLTSTKSNINELSTALYKSGTDGQAAFVNLAKSIANANQPMLKTNALLNQMLSTLGNTLRWEISSRILHGFERSIQQAYSYSKNLNKSLTDIRIVTGYSADRMADFAIEANKAARALSATTKEYTDASLIYFQQGLSDQQVKERTDITIKMANVTRESAQTVSDQMTAVWNNFDNGSKSLEYYSDVLTALGAATASSTAEITEGLEKFAAVAETVGLSYEYASAALTTITSNTRQSASEVGTALKTLLSRIQGLKLGETLDDGTDLNKYSKALDAVGISIKDQNGQLKAMDDLLDEMAAKWKTLNNDQQVALAQTVAGVRQYTQLIALMENWSGSDNDNMLANLRTASGAEGSLQKQADIYAESWEAARDRATAALEDIYNTLLDSDFFIKLTDSFAHMTTGIGSFLKGIDGMKGILIGVAGILLTNFAHKIPTALQDSLYNIKVLFGGAKKEAVAFQGVMNEVFVKAGAENSFSQSQKVEIAAAQNLMNARNEYAKISSKLSASEAQFAEIRLNALENEQKQWIELAQSIENYEAILAQKETTIKGSNLDYQLNKGAEKAWNKQDVLGYDAYTESLEIFEKKALSVANRIKATLKETLLMDSKDFQFDSKKIEEIFKPLEEGFNRIKNLMGSKDITAQDFGGYKQSILDFANALPMSVKKVEGFATALEKLKNSNNGNEASAAIDNIVNAIKKLKAEDLGEFNDKLQTLLSKIIGSGKTEEAVNNILNLGDATEKLPKAADNAKTAYESFINGLKHIPGTVESISKAAGGLSSFAMSLNGFKSAWEALSNPDLSGFEKFISISMSLGWAIGGLNSSIKTYKDLLEGSAIAQMFLEGTTAKLTAEKAEETAATIANTIADVANTKGDKKAAQEKALNIIAEKIGIDITKKSSTETLKNTVAQKLNELARETNTKEIKENTFEQIFNAAAEYFNKKATDANTDAQNKNTKAIIKRIAVEKILPRVFSPTGIALGLLTAAIIAATVAYKRYNEVQTEEAQMNLAKQALDETTTAAEEAKNAYEELKSTVEDYNNSVKAIDELTKGTEEYSKAIEDANEKAKELIETYGLYKDWEYGEGGLIKIDKNVLDKKIREERNAANEAQNQKYGAEIYAQNRTLEYNQEQLIKEISNKYRGSDYVEKDTAQIVASGMKKGSSNNVIKEELTFKKVFDDLQDELQEIDDLDSLDGENILNELKNSFSEEEITPIISQIFTDEELTNAIKEYTAMTMEAADASRYFAEQIVRSKIEEQYGERLREKATIDGVFNQQLYDEYLNAMVLGSEDFTDSLAEDIKEADIGSITSNNDLNNFLKDYTSSGEFINNDKDLAMAYARIVKGIEDTSTLSYIDGKNKGSIQDINGEYLFQDISDDVMRKAIAQELYRQELINNSNFDLKNIDQASSNIVSGVNKNYGVDLSTAILRNINNDNNEVFDLSSIYSSLNPEQAEGLQNTKSQEELLSLLGFTEQDLEDMGWDMSKSFFDAFQNGLKDYSEKDWERGFMDQGKANAEAAGFDPEVYETFFKTFKEGHKDLKITEEQVHELALANMQCEAGLKEIAENWDDWQEALKKTGTPEAAEAQTKLNEALSKIVNVNKELTKSLPKDFAKKYKKEIEAAVKGEEGAVQKLQKLILDNLNFEDIDFSNILSFDIENIKSDAEKIYNIIKNLDMSTIEIGADIDNTKFIAACNDLLATGKMTGDQMVEYLKMFGFNAVVNTKKVPLNVAISMGAIDESAAEGLSNFQKLTTMVDIPAVEIITYDGSSFGGDFPDGADYTEDSGSKAEPLEYEDEIERYHENTRQIERLTRALEKVSTAKDRAFGKHRLALIDDEIEATEALVQQQRALLAETREYLKQDFAEIQQYGFTYDEFGELTNYDEVMKEQIDKYNAVVATGNEDAIEAAKKEYEEFKENMEQYEETLTQYEEAQAQLQEYINQVVDLKLEKITTEVEIKILVNDKELTRLEYLLRKVEYEGKGAADAIALMGRQFEQISEKAKPIQEAIDKIYEQARAEGRGLLEEEVREIKTFYEDGEITTEEKKRMQEIYDKAASEDRMLTQAEEEQIQEYKEQLLELNEEVMDIVETIEGKFMETLEELNGKVDESIGRFATYTGMFQTLSDVITLSGKANSKYGMDMLNTLSARTVANASTAMRSNLRSYEALDQIYKEEQANLERAIKTGDERLIKQYQDRLHEVEMMRETSYESMLSSWTEALQAANDLFDTKLTNMITSLKQNLGDIDKLVEIYDRAVELEDLYISGNKSIYELSKLARDVGKDIDKTANIIAKNKLVNLLEQINKMRAEGVKLSQYDLEYWQAKYELELAEIALQEAQEAKAQVKLTRNTAGGWGYTYVADAEAIGEAQQNYEDSLYNMQELHDEYIRDYSERLIKNRQDLVNALQDLDKTSLTFEEDALRLKEHHFKQEEYLIDELNKAYQRAGVSYQDTLLAQTYGGASLEDSHSNFINSVAKMIQDELLPGYQEFQESVDGINSQAGTTVEDAMDKIFESSITMEDEVIKNINDLTSGVKEVSDEIWNFQETYGEAISKMLADNEEYYSKTIKMYQNFMDETEADKWLQYFDDMRGPGEVLGLAGSGATGAMAGNGSTAITNSAFGSILQQSTKGKSNSSSSKSYSNDDDDDNDDELIAAAKEAARKAGKDYYVYEKGGVATIAPFLTNEDGTGDLLTSDLYTKDGQTLQTVNNDRTLNLSKGPLTDAQEELRKHNDGKGYVYDPKTQKFVKPDELATGGYTGSWGSEGRLAVLHEKELVLNKYDTENMLDMINTLRDIDWRAKLSELFGNIQERLIAPIFGGGDNLQQDVRIEASFPGISDRNELTEAFNNLINTASQYANRRRY